jgi:aerobic carbon-monoxide dehydrogenase medium subunit
VIPAEFDYTAPASLDEAISLLALTEEEAKPLAGGQSLLPLMKLRLASPALLVDLRRLPGLGGVERSNGDFSVGALTRHAEVADTPELGIAARAAALIADQQVRNRGTIGGTIAHADPAADMPAVLLAAEGSVVARGPRGERTIGAGDLFLGYLTTALEPGEVITRVVLPALDGYGFHYEKFTRRAEDWAIVGVVALMAIRDGVCEDVRIGLTNMGATPLRAFAVEEALRGKRVDAETIARASERAADDAQPPEDLNATPEYKRELAHVLTRRALERALETASANPSVRPALLHRADQLAAGAAAGADPGRRGNGGLTLRQSFDVKAPLEPVWSSFVQVAPIVPCLPGAELTGASDGVFQGNFRVKVGPASASYRGTVKLESVDEASHKLVMRASGQDQRGQGSASATITLELSQAEDGGTHVEATSRFSITGTLARFGRSGMIEDVANLMMRRFAACIERKLTGTGGSASGAPMGAIGLALSLATERARRVLERLRTGR